MAVLCLAADRAGRHCHAGAARGDAERHRGPDLARVSSLSVRPVSEGNVPARWIVLSLLGGAGLLHTCNVAQQVRGLFRLYYISDIERFHLASPKCRDLFSAVWDAALGYLLGLFRRCAVPRGVELVHAVLAAVLRAAIGRGRAVLAARKAEPLAGAFTRSGAAFSRRLAAYGAGVFGPVRGHRRVDRV